MKLEKFICGRSVTLVLIWLLLWAVCVEGETRKVRHQTSLTPEQIKKVVNNINLIEGLSQKAGEPQWDKHALAIVALGKRAAPFLMEKITDASPSRVAEFFHYTIGDVALVLLHDIYKPPGWPFPDNKIKLSRKYGDFRDYTRFIKSTGARQKLKKSWTRYIKEH